MLKFPKKGNDINIIFFFYSILSIIYLVLSYLLVASLHSIWIQSVLFKGKRPRKIVQLAVDGAGGDPLEIMQIWKSY